MDSIFKDMINKGWLIIYMDDMLIYSSDKAVHQERVLRVLDRLKKHDLFLKAEKCVFDVAEVEFLGLILKPGELHMDPFKLEGIQAWPVPENIKQVQSFLGFGNFYQKFI